MKRRRGVTVFSTLALTFTILAAASYGVIVFALLPMFKDVAEIQPFIEAFDLLARNKDIIAAFTTFNSNDLTPNILVFGYIGLFVILTTIWLIVGLKRSRKIVFFFACIFLVSCYVDLLYNLTVLPLKDYILEYYEAYPYVLVPVGGVALSGIAFLFAIILFIVDLATGRVEKQVAPTFIKEPTEEVEEGVFEEVKDENEVAPVEEPVKEEEAAPAVEEAAPAVVEEKVEEAPVEEEKEEEKPAPAKKAPAKKSASRKPAKKEEKKAPAKKAPAKKEAPKKAEPAPKKDDARKTQTIVLTNEDGNTYAKAFHVSRRPELNKWQVKATGSDKALKLFNTQKEAIEYANQLAEKQNVSVRVHSKEGKIRKVNG